MLRVASGPRSKRVFIEAYDAVEKLQCRGKSIAASIPSGSFDHKQGRKKVSKQERRAIVEAFVDKYRASNQGRFPTASHARQHTGGSFYIVKQIIQELEYNLRISAPNEHKGTQLGKTEKVNDPTCSVELDGLSRSSKMADQLSSLKLEGDATCSPTREIECGAGNKTYAESFQGAHSHKEYKQANSHDIPKSDEHTGVHLKISERSESSPRGLNLWGNLKSLADGIAKFWKKM